MNQCDGCQRGLPVWEGNHYSGFALGKRGVIVMVCTKKKYSSIKIEPVDNHDNEEYLKAQCIHGHVWGDGKTVDLHSKCPECGEEVFGTLERKIMSIDAVKAKGWIGSKGKMQ